MLCEEFHCKIDSVQVPAFNREIPWLHSSDGHTNCIVRFNNLFCHNINSHIHTGANLQAFSHHDVDSSVDSPLVELKIRDSIPEQATYLFILLKKGNSVARLVKLIGSGHSGRAAANDCHFPACSNFRRSRLYIAFGKCTLNDGHFILTNGYRCIIYVQYARVFTGCRANPSCKFRKIVGGMQPLTGSLPVALVKQFIPFRNQVVHRTSPMAIGNAAIHTPGCL